jgi:hypothetical protein
VSLVGVAVALAAPGVPLAPAEGVDLVPVLTSTPFGATGGQSVTHTVVVSANGTGSATAVRVTFTSTVALGGTAASATQGQCSIQNDQSIVCDLGVVTFATADATPPKVTISGTVAPNPVPGTLVQNLVKVSSEPADSDTSNNSASNAFLFPGGSGGASSRPTVAPASGGTARRPVYLLPVAAGALTFGVVLGVAALRRRRR